MERTKHIISEEKPSFNFKGTTILTCDPSSTAFGLAIVGFDNTIITTGCIKTEGDGKKSRIRKADQTTRRISEINKILLDHIRKYNVCYIVAELQHGSQNAAAAKWQGAVTALIQAIADTLDIGVEWYSEGDSKKCLLGRISATKMETMEAIDNLYKVPKTKGIGRNRKGATVALWSGVQYIDEAVADALSIHYVASKQSPTLKYMKNGK